MKCTVCGTDKSTCDATLFDDGHLYTPSRLSVETWSQSPAQFYADVALDGNLVFESECFSSESEARAAAEQYKAELLAHIRAGGE